MALQHTAATKSIDHTTDVKTTSRNASKIGAALSTIEHIEMAQDAIFDRLQRIQVQKQHLNNLLEQLKESYENEAAEYSTDDDESGFSSDEDDEEMQRD